jgi:hypothetical protein
MQFFFYRSSLAFQDNKSKENAIKFLEYLKNIFTNVIPKLLETSNELKQIVFGEANSLESHDVLHTTLSYSVANKFLPSEAKNINKK